MSIQQNDRRPRQVSGLREVLMQFMDQMQIRPQAVSQMDVAPSVNNLEGSRSGEELTPQFRVVPPRGEESRSSFAGDIQPAMSLATNGLNRLFLSPVISGVLRLFNQRNEIAPAPLERFSPLAGALLERSAVVSANGEMAGIRRDAFGAATSSGTGVPPVQISIQALDARSILERSGDIAQAVRQAMLSNHEINSELGEL